MSRNAVWLAMLFSLLALSSPFAQETPQAKQPVSVGLYLSPPFVMQEQGQVHRHGDRTLGVDRGIAGFAKPIPQVPDGWRPDRRCRKRRYRRRRHQSHHHARAGRNGSISPIRGSMPDRGSWSTSIKARDSPDVVGGIEGRGLPSRLRVARLCHRGGDRTADDLRPKVRSRLSAPMARRGGRELLLDHVGRRRQSIRPKERLRLDRTGMAGPMARYSALPCSPMSPHPSRA